MAELGRPLYVGAKTQVFSDSAVYLARLEREERHRRPYLCVALLPTYNVRRSESEAWKAAHSAPPDLKPGDPPFRVMIVPGDRT